MGVLGAGGSPIPPGQLLDPHQGSEAALAPAPVSLGVQVATAGFRVGVEVMQPCAVVMNQR